MVDPDVRQQLKLGADRDAVRSVLLEWTASPDASLFAGAHSKRDRLRVLDTYFEVLKSGLLERLREEPVELQDLHASGQAILSGTVAVLEPLVSPGGLLDREAGVQVHPNVMFHSLGVAVD